MCNEGILHLSLNVLVLLEYTRRSTVDLNSKISWLRVHQ